MIRIDEERCNGCGVCLEVCPVGALYLVDGKAQVDETLCRDCEACVAACPMQCIVPVAQPVAATSEPVRVPAVRPEPGVVQVRARPEAVPWRSRVRPVLGSALAWAGRELVPRLADYARSRLDRWLTGPRAVSTGGDDGAVAGRGAGSGGQHRHRRRGGRG